MALTFLDFLSGTPSTFIFKKNKNKTDFGGVLFLIYMIIMALITLTYIYDYLMNDKYIVDALTHINTTYVEKDKSLKEDDELNPYADFNITISGYNDVDGQFVLQTKHSDDIITEDYNIKHTSIFNLKKMRVDRLAFRILYACGKDENCSSYYYDEYDEIDPQSIFTVLINYTGYKLHHSDDIPMEITEDSPKTFRFEIGFLDSIYEYLNLYWIAIIYKDQKSLFDYVTHRKRKYVYGEIKNSKTVLDPGGGKKDFIFWDDATGSYYMPLIDIWLYNEHKEYIEYKRIEIKFLDVIAKICALFSTLKFIFSTILKFYTLTFSNYKMVDMILKYPKEIKDSKDKSDKESTSNKKEIISKIDDLPLLNDSTDENKLSINEQDDKKESNENNSEESPPFVLKKISFVHFLLNSFNAKCCYNNKNQEILNSINEIALKYLSLDYLLYNQIKLENLFKDYKWNNPLLNNIQTNNLIMKLKNICNDG